MYPPYRRSVFALLSLCLLLALVAVPPETAHANPEKNFGPAVDLGAPIQTVAAVDAVFGKEDGYNVMYTTVSGGSSIPAVFNVVDLDRQQLLRSFPLPGTASSWTHVKTNDGRVFIGASNKMFVYSPQTKEITDLGAAVPAGGSIWALTADEFGNVYGGTYPKGSLFRIDAATLQMTDMGQVDDGTAPGDDGKPESYVRSLEYYKGYVYAGTGSLNGRVWKINPQTGEKVRIELPLPLTRPEYGDHGEKYSAMGFCYGLKVIRNYLFAFFNGPFSMLVYDLDNERWLDTGFTNIRGLVAVTSEYNGKVYTAKKDMYLWEIDLDTMTERRFIPFDASLRNNAVLQLQNQPDFPNPALVTLEYGGGALLIDPSGKTGHIRSLVEGQATSIQSLEAGPDGKLYMSGYPGSKGAQYDPVTGQNVNFPLGQAEGMGSLGDTMYFGIYPHASIAAWDTRDALSETVGPADLFSIPDEQDRPFVFTSGDNKLFIGTVPVYGTLGGSLTVYDAAASESSGQPVFESFRNVVQDQSIVGLAYKDGKLYGSTSVAGGLGMNPSAPRAKMFVWDVAQKQKVTELELNLEGLQSLPMISGLSVGPDGRIWGAANGILFAMNPATYEIEKVKNIYPDVTSYGQWRPVYIRWGQDGYLYTNIAGRLTVVDPNTLDHQPLNIEAMLFTLDRQDNIYFAAGTRLKKLPAASGPVDSAIQLLSPSQPTDVAEGSDIPVVVKAKPGWTVQVTEGTVLLAEAEGQGETPVTLTIPKPAVGSHSYVLIARSGSEQSDPVKIPTVTVHALDRISITGKPSIEVGETANLSVSAIYGPVTVPVGGKATITANPAGIVKIEGTAIRGEQPGQATVTAAYGGKQASMLVEVKPAGSGDPTKQYLELVNPSFEAELNADGTIPGWSVYSYKEGLAKLEISTEQAKAGTHSFKLTDQSTSNPAGIASDYVQVEPNEVYEAHVGVYLGNPPPSFSSSRTLLWLRYYDASYQELPPASTQSLAIENPRGTWIDAKVSGKAPANAVYARIILLCSVSWVTTAYYDDVTMFKQVSAVNTPPTVSPIATQYTVKDRPTGAVAFSVGDKETPASLAVTATSSNPELVEASGIVISGSGSERTVQVTPVSGKTGKTAITVTVSDGELSAVSPFDVYVVTANALPTETYHNSRTFELAWDGGPAEGLSGVKLYYSENGGVEWKPFGGVHAVSPIAFEAPNDGTYAFAIRAVDASGHEEAPPSSADAAQTVTTVDTAAPVVTFVGNQGVYDVDEQIAITCSVSDALSGVVSSTCPTVTGAAYGFALGNHVYVAEAADAAGNAVRAETAFTVKVSYDSLASLTCQFVTNQAIGIALSAVLQEAEILDDHGNEIARKALIKAYQNQVAAQKNKSLTEEQVEILTRLAQSL